MMKSMQVKLKWSNYQNVFSHYLPGCCNQSLFSDAMIACEGQIFMVHRIILSASSRYFEEIFHKIPSDNARPVIVLSDISVEILEWLLSYMYCGEVTIPRESILSLIRLAKKFKIKELSQQLDPELDERQVVPGNVEDQDDGSVDINAQKKLKRKYPERSNPQTKKSSSSLSLGLQSDSSSCMLTPPLQTVAKSPVSLELPSDCTSCVLTPLLQTDTKSSASQELPSNTTSCVLPPSNVTIKPSTAKLKNNIGPRSLPPPTGTVPETLTSPSRPIVTIPLSALSAGIHSSVVSCTQMPFQSSPLVGKCQDARSSVLLKTVRPSSGSSTVTGTSTAKHNGSVVVEGPTFKFFPAGRTTDLLLLPEIKDEIKKERVMLGPDGTLSVGDNGNFGSMGNGDTSSVCAASLGNALGIRQAASDSEAVKEQANGSEVEDSKEQTTDAEGRAHSPPPDVFSQIAQPYLEMSEILEEEKKEPIILGPDDPLFKDDYDDGSVCLSGDNTSMLPEVTSVYVSTSNYELGVRQSASDQDPVSEQREIRVKRKKGRFTFRRRDSLPLEDDDVDLNNWSDDDAPMLPDLTYLVPTSTANYTLSNKQAASDTEKITEQAKGGEVEDTKEQASGEEGGGPISPSNMLPKIFKPFMVMPEIKEVGKKEMVTLGTSHPRAIDGDDLGGLSDNTPLMPKVTSSVSNSTPNKILSIKQATTDPEKASGGERESFKEQASGKKDRRSIYPPDAPSHIVQPCVVMLSRLLNTPEIKKRKKESLPLGPGDQLSKDDHVGALSDDDFDVLPDLTLEPNSNPKNALSMKQRALKPKTVKQQAIGGKRVGSKELANGEEGGGLSSPPDVLTRIVQPCMKMPKIKKRKKESLPLGSGDQLSVDDHVGDPSDEDFDVLPDLTLEPSSNPKNALSMKQRALKPETVRRQANRGEGVGSKALAIDEEGGGLSSLMDLHSQIVQPCMKMQMSRQRRLASTIQPKSDLDSDEMPLSVVKKQLAVKRQSDLEEEEKPLAVIKKNILESDSKVAGCPQGRLQKPKANTLPCPSGRISKEKLQKKKFSASKVNTPKQKLLKDGITVPRAVNSRPRRQPYLQVSKLDKRQALPGNDEGHNDTVYVDLPKALKKKLSENSNVKIKKATSSKSLSH